MTLYEELFPIGTRVMVVAPDPSEGSDHRFNGKLGTVERHGHWMSVRLDKPLATWPNPVTVCPHNLQKIT